MPLESHDAPTSLCIIPKQKSFCEFLSEEKKRPSLSQLAIALKSNILTAIDEKKKVMLYFILQKRLFYIKTIQHYYRCYSQLLKIKKNILLNKLIQSRQKSAVLLQSYFRMRQCRKHFNKLLSNDALFLYSYPLTEGKEEKINSIVLSLHKPNVNANFHYSKYLNQFYLSINKVKLFRKKMKVNFIINGHKVIDSRYEVGNDSKGNFYNIIYSTMIFKKLKQRSPKVDFKRFKMKKWEDFFVLNNSSHHQSRKLSFDTSSIISDQTDISKEMNGNINYTQISSIIKPILKCKNSFMKDNRKKVSFCKTVQFCY